jgi:very-short-patch-repair endonuclease
MRNRQIGGRKFRRQAPIGRYIVDFSCMDAKVIVELDGGQHAAQHHYDDVRDNWLTSEGYRVLRFWNNEVMENLDGVLQRILQELEDA